MTNVKEMIFLYNNVTTFITTVSLNYIMCLFYLYY